MTSFRSDTDNAAERARQVLLHRAQTLQADLEAAMNLYRGARVLGTHDAEHVFGEAWSQSGDVVEELEARP